MSEDDAVRATNDDAASCKRSAVQLGYWKDPYIDYFIRASERRAPEINRGYYARVQGVHTLLKQFLEITKDKGQVVNLGAGFDTSFWMLKDEGFTPRRFIEVDFQGVTSRKTYYIQHRKPLLDKLATEDGEVQFSKTDLHSEVYHIVAADLRNIKEFEQKLTECGIDKSLPTVFVAECVLVYMPVAASADLLSWIPQQFTTAFFINYEQVNMGDRFGQVMIENLRSRGCSLAGVEYCQSLDSQKNRFVSTGWTGADSLDMMAVYRAFPQADVQSMTFPKQLTFLQQDLFSHYSLTWSYVDLSESYQTRDGDTLLEDICIKEREPSSNAEKSFPPVKNIKSECTVVVASKTDSI